jgi:nitric oxide reductase NorE protein
MGVTVDAPDAPAAPRWHVPGEPGIWVVVLGDMLVFALLFVVELVSRAHDPGAAAASQARLDPGLGAVNTLLLLVSSLLVVGAVRALRTTGAARRLAPPLLVAAMGCGVAFSAIKIVEYSGEVASGATPMTNDFFLYYFLLTGFHWFHLLLGLGVLAVLTIAARRPSLSARGMGYVEGGACFWHMVDLLWIVLYPLLYLAR